MLTTPQIVTTQAKTAAVIRLAIPRSDMMKSFGPAVAELMATRRAGRAPGRAGFRAPPDDERRALRL
jgi:hypothetical protein